MIYVYLCIYATQIIQRQERQIQSLWFGTDIHIPDNLLVPFTGTRLKRFKKKKPFSMEISSLVMYLSWDRVQVFPCQKPAAAACISYVILILCSHFFFQLWLLRGEKKEFIGKREQREKGGLQSRLHHNLSKKRAELIVYSLIIFFRYISYLLDSLVYSQLQKKCLPSL